MNIILETQRLVLKLPTILDFDDLLKLRQDPNVMRYIGTGAIQTPNQVKEFIDNVNDYANKFGMGFYSIYEKETNQFVGQAGLFHLGFDTNQSDIEVAYRLHTHYWNQGYATEVVLGLINYGFKTLSLPKIVAIVHPENGALRRVMEKAGMAYHGIINFKGTPLPCYEIYNCGPNFDHIQLVPALLKDWPVIQNMGRFYVYDMSEYFRNSSEWKIPDDGLYQCIDLKKYWEDEHSFPFLVYYQNEIAGFVIVDKKGSRPEIDFNMAQFFILRKFKNLGIGSYVAQEIFRKYTGDWEVMVIPGNEGAYRFWRKTIRKFTQNKFSEYTCEIAHFKNSLKNIFRFKT